MNANELAEYIMKNAPKITFKGRIYHILENDRLVSPGQIAKYASEFVALLDPERKDAAMVERLMSATVDDKMTRWKHGTVLTWTIDEETFEGHEEELKVAKDICAKATDDWNEAAKEVNVLDAIRFSPVAAVEDAAFAFAYEATSPRRGTLATAFFPSEIEEKDRVLLFPGTFSESLTYNRAGVIRHELGHVLGFRHEQIRPEAQVGMSPTDRRKMEKWVDGELGAAELGEYDSKSVMHYLVNGGGTLEFKISDKDKAGFGKLYSMAYDSEKIKEYSLE